MRFDHDDREMRRALEEHRRPVLREPPLRRISIGQCTLCGTTYRGPSTTHACDCTTKNGLPMTSAQLDACWKEPAPRPEPAKEQEA